jgi:hypothetical protein
MSAVENKAPLIVLICHVQAGYKLMAIAERRTCLQFTQKKLFHLCVESWEGWINLYL